MKYIEKICLYGVSAALANLFIIAIQDAGHNVNSGLTLIAAGIFALAGAWIET